MTRFEWELDVFLTSLRALDKETPVVLLFLEELPSVVEHFRGRYPNLEIHSYVDERTERNYLATVRPYLFWRYLSEDKNRERETYFQVESDVIFRKLPDFKTLLNTLPKGENVCLASDCSTYIDYKYLMGVQQGPYIVDKFSEILNISVEKIVETPGGGAQWLITNPTAQLWWHTWQDSQLIYDFLSPLNSNVQKWTAEMWAQLYNLVKFGWKVSLEKELSFCRPTDPIEEWKKAKMLHNAGVTGQLSHKLFYKGNYTYYSPFGKDLSWVDKTKAGWHYARAIEKAYNHIV